MKKEVKILKALGNEKRLIILHILESNKDLSTVEISQRIKLHFKSTSKHLQKLVEAGLVSQRRDGVFVRHKLKDGTSRILKDIKELK